MGAEIQQLRLDLLNLTRPGAIAAIHDAYLAAGADIIETITFNSNRISPENLDKQSLIREQYQGIRAVGKIKRDQAEDDARRRGQRVATTERWLAPILNYDR